MPALPRDDRLDPKSAWDGHSQRRRLMSKRSRSVPFGTALVAIAFAVSSFAGLASRAALAQDATPAAQVGTKADLASTNWTWPVDNVIDGKKVPAMYQPIDPTQVSKKWNICVSFPHLKDPYWLGADYGIVEEVKRDGAQMQLYEAGGYTELDKQLSQLDDCVAQGAQAIILGAISADGVNAKVEEIVGKGIPVIDFVNGINTPKVSAHALVSFYDMGHNIGDYMKENLVTGDD